MSTIAIEIWPYLLTALISAIGMYVGAIHKLKLEVAVLKKTVEDQQKSLDNIQKRQDSHSKKTDDILDTVNQMKLEVLKQMGAMNTNIGSLASDVKNLNNLLAISDMGIAVKRQNK